MFGNIRAYVFSMKDRKENIMINYNDRKSILNGMLQACNKDLAMLEFDYKHGRIGTEQYALVKAELDSKMQLIRDNIAAC